ncbi:MAG TPA: MBL fold metallo-hydrolase [Thermoleophilaceae bacterium]|nr:MBL fold metallo-hydrolase [Thermoleophilaceae bacterium]
MLVEWYGQSAFRLEADGKTVAIDPFGDVSGLASRGIHFDYPPIEGLSADLLLVTHEHGDHNGVEAVGGDPVVLRSKAGTFESPVGEVVGIASEHDPTAGTQRGPNTIYVFELGGVRVSHFGDFGQTALRDEQAEAIGTVDMLMIPVGAGPTIGPEQADDISRRLGARWIVPMHYRTERIGFLDPPDAFLERMPHVHRLDAPSFDTAALPDESPLVVLPKAP